MQAPTPTRAPPACSFSSVAARCEDMVSLPGAEDDNEPTYTSRSGSRTLCALEDDSDENCTPREDIRSGSTKQQPDPRYGSDSIEEPKPIWTKSRMKAFRHFLLMHLAPVGTTLVLFWLYLQGFQWSANDIQLKALLFAAKLHESLIVVSLGDILFHRIRYHLLTGRGISFGLLVSPFRVPNPLSLFQIPFMASAKFTFKSGPELVTVLLVILVSVLALLAAPSSGVLMLPRYDWWQIPSDEDVTTKFKGPDQETATYIGAQFDDLFPLLIDGRFGPDKVRDDKLDIPNLSDRFEQIINGFDRVLVNGSLRANANITVADGATVDSFTLAYQEENWEDCEAVTCQEIADNHDGTVESIKAWYRCPVGCQSIAVQATSPLALVTQKLFERYRTWTSASSSMIMITAQALDSKRGDLTWRQPHVSMQCSTVPHAGATSLSFPNWGPFPVSISPDRQLLEQIHLMEAQDAPLAVSAYIDISRLIPAGATASTALLMHRGQDNPTYLCLVDARWIESKVWFTAPYGAVMRSGVSMESLRATNGLNITTSPVINITPEYGNSLDANLTIASTILPHYLVKEEYRPFAFIEQYCFARADEPLRPKCSFLAHALYLTDSLRRTQSIFRYRSGNGREVSDFLSLSDPDKWTKLDYRLYHQLHAYKFEGSIIKLSMTVLLVHMMLVYAHFLLLFLGDGWCSRAWSELGELMALAILTQPSPLLRNAGAGVKSWQTWRLRTFVRELTPEGRLELVLKEPVGSPRVLVGLEEGQEKALVEPEADRRYG